jgi:hypothetical protein
MLSISEEPMHCVADHILAISHKNVALLDLGDGVNTCLIKIGVCIN